VLNLQYVCYVEATQILLSQVHNYGALDYSAKISWLLIQLEKGTERGERGEREERERRKREKEKEEKVELITHYNTMRCFSDQTIMYDLMF
jgi:hypothetical protein